MGRANKALIKEVHAPLHPKGFTAFVAGLTYTPEQITSVTITTLANKRLREPQNCCWRQNVSF